MFDESVAVQKASRNLVIYSALAGQIVTVAWPSYKGIKIKPSGIKEWLRARGLHWGCFCGMAAPSKVCLSSRIIHAAKGKVVVFCHDEVSTCNFFLDLSNLYEITTHISDYPTLPKLDQCNRDAQRETAELVNFHLGQLAMSEIAPLLKGFCGDFVRGVEQLAGGTIQTPLRLGTANKMIRRNSSWSLPTFAAPIASTSKGEVSASHPSPVSLSPSKRLQDQRQRQRLLDQCEILDRLAEGEGIAPDEWAGVIEKCYVCDKVMLEAVFKDHSRDCWHLSDVESDPDEWGKQ